MTDSPEQPSDEELSELIDDEENSVTDESNSDESGVEVGIPPPVEDEGGVDTSEEAFSMDDFDTAEVVENPIEEKISQEADTEEIATDEDEELVVDESPSSDEPEQGEEETTETNGSTGGVAEFRKTLSNLSRQLEIDRLAFLHQSMKDRGEKVPTLSQIAADIQGTKSLVPEGDCDKYGKRPSARLDGWVSGLSFGTNRRAKKFSK